MSNLSTIGIALVAAGLGSFTFTRLLTPAAPVTAPPADLEIRLAALQQTTQQLAAKVEQLAQAPVELRAEPRVAVPAVTDEQVRKAVESWLASQGRETALLAAGPAQAEGQAPATSFDVPAAVQALTRGNLDWDARSELWKQARDAKQLDQLLAACEQWAAENSGVAEAQMQLGQAYLEKLSIVPDGPEKGTWAIKADKAFDAALAIDDHHWGARFAKGMSLSFWPPVFGKGGEAIRQFETLIEQQEKSGATTSEQAQVYTLLGNLYEQQGRKDDAMSVWRRGALRHPEDAGLQERQNRR